MSKLNTKTIVIIGVVVVILIAVVAKILVSKAEERNRGKNGPPKPTPGNCKALSFEARDGVKEYCAYIKNEADCTSSKDPIVGGRDCQWVTG
jgi:hypothetical protein